MLKTHASVKAQLDDVDNVKLNNPLGRILSVYENQNGKVDLETLEMKLDEAVLKELPSLEKGLSLIKLLAAVAPLLGLLGTVTGMISVFDVMAVTGTGDARAMASGISKATVPTMAGMVVSLIGLYFKTRFDGMAKKQLESFQDRLLK